MSERNDGRRPIDVSGIYHLPTKYVTVNGPEDLIKNGIAVHPQAVAATWGPEAAERYVEEMQKK